MKQIKSPLLYITMTLCIITVILLGRGNSAWRNNVSKQEIWYHRGYSGDISGVHRGMSARTGPIKMPYIFREMIRQNLVPLHQIHVDHLQGAKPPALPIDLYSLQQVHTDRFLNALFTGQPWELATSQGLNRWNKAIARGWLLNTGGFYEAASTALKKNIITGNLGHGYHHALPDRGMEYCTINGLAVVAKKLIRQGKTKRVMIIDLDEHEGNGTAISILGDDAIWNVSIYEDYMGGPPATQNNHVHQVEHRLLPKGQKRDINYLAIIAKTLPALIRAHNPDIILYQAGMDPYDGAGISEDALAIRDAYVFSLARSMNKAVTWVLAGGYAKMETLVKLHTNTIRMANQALIKVHPKDRLVYLLDAPYQWSHSEGKVIFPNWFAMAQQFGGVKVRQRSQLENGQIRNLVKAQHHLFQHQCLPATQIQKNYRALFED